MYLTVNWSLKTSHHQNVDCLIQVQHEAEILFSLVEGKRVVTMFDYYEKGEHSLLVLEYLKVPW